jgi:hypothetical protein
LEVVLNFIIQNLEKFGSWAKKEICLSTSQVWKFLEKSKIVICIFELGTLEPIGKELDKRND